MGCNTSTLDRLPAVALCRDRCKFIDEALHQSYAVADAHVAHMHSLKQLGPALHRFFAQFEDDSGEDENAIKAQPSKSPLPAAASPDHSSFSSSDSDSHILLHSESEADDDTDKESQFFNRIRYDYLNLDDTVSTSAPDNVAFTNYAQPFYPPFSSPLLNSKPPSPPPPSSSTWDFLNLFETFEKYQVPRYSTPASETADIKEEEEKKKRVEVEEKKKERIGAHRNEDAKKGDGGGEGGKVKEAENGQVKNKEPHSTEKSSVPHKVAEERGRSNSAKVKSPKAMCEAMKQIQILFERASDSGNPILEMLDVGKLRYHRKLAVDPVSCKMTQVFTPSIPSKPLTTVKLMEPSLLGPRMGAGHQDKGLTFGNICATLNKLCMWEKKLYDEVKAEEKLRILHEKKCRQLRRMNRKGSDAHKVDSVETLIGILATKMKISIQVVNKISNTISKLREEELWPLINTFILRFHGMWKDMLECYRCQYQEIAEAKSLNATSINRNLSNSHLDAALKLKSEIQNWNLSFSDWIYAQKSHVKALNGWLVRCLLHEPEEIPHDTAPFSPGRIGAPPVFVICTKWSRAVDNLSEKYVIEAVNGFILRVNELLEKHISELQQKLTLDKELERRVKMLERQEQKMHKVVLARERKMVPIAREETDSLLRGDGVHHGELVDPVSLLSCLKHIIAAMERFTATTARTYEELCQQIGQEDDHVLGESNNIN